MATQCRNQKNSLRPLLEVLSPSGKRLLRAEGQMAINAVIALRAIRWVGAGAVLAFSSQYPAFGEMIIRFLDHL